MFFRAVAFNIVCFFVGSLKPHIRVLKIILCYSFVCVPEVNKHETIDSITGKITQKF